ncbi:MAG: TatD family hydrolase [Clostridia bacterium]|nr:TatD family hydrolase [Clostridia bacterium]
MRLFDSHSHYNDDRFDEYPGGAAGALKDSFDSGICGILCAGTNPENTLECIALAESDSRIWASAGMHPGDSRFIDRGDEQAVLDRIRKLLDHPRVCALGEIGLDYHYGGEDKDQQKLFFDSQLSMAEELGLPVIVHDREAHGDTFDILRAHKGVTGVMHSFSGSAEMAKELVRMGWYISFSGPVTYKNAHNLREAAAVVPDDRILVETDAPYLTPVPHRGKINLSAYMEYTARAIAEVRDADFDRFCEQTVENTMRLFGLTL